MVQRIIPGPAAAAVSPVNVLEMQRSVPRPPKPETLEQGPQESRFKSPPGNSDPNSALRAATH